MQESLQSPWPAALLPFAVDVGGMLRRPVGPSKDPASVLFAVHERPFRDIPIGMALNRVALKFPILEETSELEHLASPDPPERSRPAGQLAGALARLTPALQGGMTRQRGNRSRRRGADLESSACSARLAACAAPSL